MKRILLALSLVLITCAGVAVAANPFQVGSKTETLLKDSKQMVVVITNGWSGNEGQLQRYARKSSKDAWKAVGSPSTVVVGKNGLGWSYEMKTEKVTGPYKREGDKKSPAGVFELGPAFGFSSNAKKHTKLYYLPLQHKTICVTDPRSQYYGRIVNPSKVKNRDWRAAELMRNHQQYQWGIVVGYNMAEIRPNAGSCIFLHVWQSPQTSTIGSTAMSKDEMNGLLKWLQPTNNPVLVQLPRAEYQKFQQKWQLPNLPA